MLVSSECLFALRCSACGRQVERSFSLFDIDRHGAVSCVCGAWTAKLIRRRRGLEAQLRCVGCQRVHEYRVRVKELMKGRPVTLYCHDSQYAIGYIGEDEAVRVAISHQDSLENLVFDPDYADFFDHPNLMFETLAMIQALAEVGRLDCACGSDRIAADLAPDRVSLVCLDCGGTAEAPATCGDDLVRLRGLKRLRLESPRRITAAREGRG